MEKIEKNKKQTQDLLERAVTLAELAGKCHRLGLINDFVVNVNVYKNNDLQMKVAVNQYWDDEKVWYETIGSVSSEPRAKEIAIDFESMMGYLEGLIYERKTQLLAELEIVEG